MAEKENLSDQTFFSLYGRGHALYPASIWPQQAGVVTAPNGMLYYLPCGATHDMGAINHQRHVPRDPMVDVRTSASFMVAGEKNSPSAARPKIAEEKKSPSVTKKSPTTKGASSGERIYIDRVGDWDILCGRGGRSNHHYGNKRYRNVINEMKMKYRSTEKKLAKTDLSKTIVEYVYNYGGRFLKKGEKVGKYYLLTPKEARRKTSQALREHKDIKWVLKS